ncbi:MAG: UDP-2,3-diacylglucosamine diphosphatase LpxI [bacterium]
MQMNFPDERPDHAEGWPAAASFPRRIGLIAGGGDFPLLLARSARANGVEIIVFALKGFASREMEMAADKVEWLELGQAEKAIQLMHAHGITEVAMAGRVPHNSIFQYRHFDWRALKALARAVNKKADSLLGIVTSELERAGIRVIDSTMFLKSLMPGAELLTPARPLTKRERHDIDFGYPIAKVVAGQDIGQTIVVKDGVVAAVEGIEGTDECILRAGRLAGGGCVVIKVSKPRQDNRFDVPVIGRQTLLSMRESHCAALAFSAWQCLLFDREEVLRIASEADIAIITVEG